MRIISLISILTFFSFQAFAQPSTARVYEDLLKLQNTSRVLYVAAHPDDENTRFISYCANALHAEVAYLSLTRGDGGQNLIGTELRENLGLIRTYELLSARKVDGGTQLFTRANDYGYSKNAEEALEKWDEDSLLADMVTAIRTFKPDVMVTRFAPPEKKYRTHGHHTTSAILAEKAMDLAADPNYKEGSNLSPWKITRLYWNTSTWFYRGSDEKFDPKDKMYYNVGDYDPVLGRSFNEIAAISRSQHRSQGFGAPQVKEHQDEWLEYVQGEQATIDLMDGIVKGWSRYAKYAPIGELINKAVESYDFKNPSASLPTLIEAHKLMQRTLMRRDMNPDRYIIERKIDDLSELILDILGLHIEFRSEEATASVLDKSVATTIESVLRSDAYVELKSVTVSGLDNSTQEEIDSTLVLGQQYSFEINLPIGKQAELTQPKWLANTPKSDAMYDVVEGFENQPNIEPAAHAIIELEIEGEKVLIERPLEYVSVDRAKGELHTLFVMTPPVIIAFSEEILIANAGKEHELNLIVKAMQDSVSGEVNIQLPQGWTYLSDQAFSFDIEKKGEEAIIPLIITPTASAQAGKLQSTVTVNEESFTAKSRTVIDYDHIPSLQWFPDATLNAVAIPEMQEELHIGYIMGAGDEVNVYLEKAGIQVSELNENNFNQTNLDQFDAILVGIRAYNTEEWLIGKKNQIEEYVQQGGNYIVQYSTTWGLLSSDFAPYSIQLGRDRVTKEEAKPTLLEAQHPVFNAPFKIQTSDFNNWVQERGLYFASEWSSEWKPLIKWNDPGESPKDGALLVAEYGKGHYVYTGISFFRELPAGVQGAYKLLINILAQ